MISILNSTPNKKILQQKNGKKQCLSFEFMKIKEHFEI